MKVTINEVAELSTLRDDLAAARDTIRKLHDDRSILRLPRRVAGDRRTPNMLTIYIVWFQTPGSSGWDHEQPTLDYMHAEEDAKAAKRVGCRVYTQRIIAPIPREKDMKNDD